MAKEIDSVSRADLERWASAWLDAQSRLTLLQIQTPSSLALDIIALDDAFNVALASNQPASTSGLVEQQAFFARMLR